MEELYGFIERITFQNTENGFCVAKLQEANKKDLTCIVGILPAVQVGESICCKGEWKRDLAYGLQFHVKEWSSQLPADAQAIEKYLASGLIKGIGPSYAKRIVKTFQERTLDIIDRFPERLSEVPGLGPKRLERIQQCWAEQRAIRSVMLFLQSHGVSPTYAQKIYRCYGDEAVQKVTDNPYSLARDIRGIGFKRADQIARELGIAADSPRRLEAGIEFTLSELSNEGHVCYPKPELLSTTAETLSVSASQIEEAVKRLVEGSRLTEEELLVEDTKTPYIWLRPLYLTELGITREIQRLAAEKSRLRAVDCDRALDWVQGIFRLKLAKEQAAAVRAAVCDKLHVITGGPGTGKSTITKAILAITEKLSSRITLAAPTGRAAKRMAEICRRPASTIHSLLEYDFMKGGFKRNASNPIDADLIVIDEASMIDTVLMYSLLKAIPDHARVILVGDIDQLPSVGPGNVLRDIIESKAVPVTRLNQIYRQGKGSRIVLNAHRINRGVMPETQSEPDADFFFVERDEKEDVLTTVIDLVTTRLPRKYRYDPLDDIQVLAPMRKGMIGIDQLNASLQERLNPKGESIQRGGCCYRVGDKVMQLRNNYQKEVFNGDIGRIRHIDHVDQELLVDFDGVDVPYEFQDLDELTTAYAVSIHKYQGSECPCIVMPVHTTHFKMLHKNLLYTGVTRGKKLVILVGSKRALAIAVNTNDALQRHTGLRQRLSC
jgi:exodeoxyribonuclease V alpha subunit